MGEKILYWLARGLIGLLQALPLVWVARIGRCGGALAWHLDRRHRRVALNNLRACLGQAQSAAAIHRMAGENFRRIGENFACAVKTASMSWEELRPHLEFVGSPDLMSRAPVGETTRVVVAIGHFGNFELYARFHEFVPRFTCATTYRALRQPSLNDLLLKLREKSGCRYFERRSGAGELKAFMHRPDAMLGLLADQHAGTHGLLVPFLGRPCSTSAAPAVFALRYDAALYTAVCFRTGLARWRVEAGARIQTHEEGKARASEEIMADVNRAFEAAVLRDPANWFWVHNRWKTVNKKRR